MPSVSVVRNLPRPGDKDYPETLDIGEGMTEQHARPVGADKAAADGYKATTSNNRGTWLSTTAIRMLRSFRKPELKPGESKKVLHRLVTMSVLISAGMVTKQRAPKRRVAKKSPTASKKVKRPSLNSASPRGSVKRERIKPGVLTRRDASPMNERTPAPI